ncbi:hypothetical protein [Microbacterium capsulatum]|uniref:Uncharacterized protein n=1 Tax=Microbacterium capsulatum TaxID=3041921 RepID=A0ABU0XF48_9MICO|nr:hypothetical protein [Microbacterium sp. ASV81]MDQ4213736.1 hypothetical protein [Microbacterium sp. ASV81]
MCADRSSRVFVRNEQQEINPVIVLLSAVLGLVFLICFAIPETVSSDFRDVPMQGIGTWIVVAFATLLAAAMLAGSIEVIISAGRRESEEERESNDSDRHET